MEKPIKLSVVIPTWNGKELLKKNLPAVIKACQAWSPKDKKAWEILVVDDASTDETVSFLKLKFPQVKVIKNKQNLRFAKACNVGVARAKGDLIILFNNDVSPMKEFIKYLLPHFEDENVFAVGCREKNKVGGKIIYGGRSLGEFRRGFLVHWRAKNQEMTDTLWANGGNMIFDRKMWRKLKGMDELFRPAYWEDIDLSWRAKKRGWKVLFEPKSIVNHYHETTNLKAFGQKEMNIIAYKNQFLFVWKNADLGMIVTHLLWLPFHFFKTLFSFDFLFTRGFALALLQLPEVLAGRLSHWRSYRK
ncbi:glycosyltransferase family 2 protein [Patescibacteria group bacterium]